MGNDDQYPRMMYKFDPTGHGSVALENGTYETHLVRNQREHDEAMKDGWEETSVAAKQAAQPKPKSIEKSIADDMAKKSEQQGAPSRQELELMAKDLNIKYDGRTSDQKLHDLIKEQAAK